MTFGMALLERANQPLTEALGVTFTFTVRIADPSSGYIRGPDGTGTHPLAFTPGGAAFFAKEPTGGSVHNEVFTNKTAFLAAVGEVVFQGFESYPRYDCAGGGPSPVTSLESESFTVTTVPADAGTTFLCTGSAGRPGPTEGNNALIAGSNTGSPFTLDFVLTGNPPAYAVGFYLDDAAEAGDAIFVTSAGDEILMLQCCRPGYMGPVFFGLISKEPFRSFQLKNTGHWDGWGIDELMLGIGARSPKK